MTPAQAISSIRTASLIGGADALQLIAYLVKKFWISEMASEVVRAWALFDREIYAKEVFPAAPITRLRIADPLTLPYIRELTSLEELELVDLDRIDLWVMEDPSITVRRLAINGGGLRNVEGIGQFPALTHLEIELSHAGTDLRPLLKLRNLECLRIVTMHSAMLGLLQLSALQNLRMLQIGQPSDTMVNLMPFEGNMNLTVVVVPGLNLMSPGNINVVQVSELPPML
jgi:hypothetical protein